jgi:transposase
MTLSGIGFYSAVLIVSETGDVKRFAGSHNLDAYAKLAPL